MTVYELIPNDVLFFRDGRPMEATVGSGGHGARWPAPSVWFDALHAAWHRKFPVVAEWEHAHRYGRSSQRDFNRDRTQRFGALATAGPFPAKQNGQKLTEWYFPAPADATSWETLQATLFPMRESRGTSDLAAPSGLHLLGARIAASKEPLPPWWNKAAIELYLGRPAPVGPRRLLDDELFDAEWSTGIGMNAETGTQNGVSIYSAEYLRMKTGEQASLGAIATLGSDNLMEKLIPQTGAKLIVGGQQRGCMARPVSGAPAEYLPVSADLPPGGVLVKWVLLSPAIWPAIPAGKTSSGEDILAHSGGWLPNWVDPKSGQVRLVAGSGKAKARRTGKPVGTEIDASLVAACVPGPVALSGWSARAHLKDDPYRQHEWESRPGPRATLLAVPAGAVYYFRSADNNAAKALVNALAWHGADGAQATRIVNRRSTLMGEKGFGLGVCGPWQFYEDVPARPPAG